jgi:hypothetical protein
MRLPLALVVLLCVAARSAPLRAAEPPAAQPGDTITWVKPVLAAFAAAEKEKKPLMICINSERVDGGRVEQAAKELRENTYKDLAVVTRSRQFVCCFLTAEGSSDDFGELRARYQIEGLIVSPQHIFAHADGTLIDRQEYWPHGTGERAVKALLALMDAALAKHNARQSLPPAAPSPAPGPAAPGAPGPAAPAPADPGAAPGDPAALRAQLVNAIVDGPTETRKEALRRLLLDDKDGLNLAAIVAAFPTLEANKDVAAQVDVVRALGRPNLKGATAMLVERLDAKDAELRGNVAVSLEYIGDPAAVDGLKGRLDREKEELVLCHVLRALGRSGAGDKAVRAALDKRIASAKSEPIACAAIIGLAHFDKDPAAARALEDHLQKVGPPSGGRRGGTGENTQKRSYLAWALAEVGDPKSAEFMRKKMLPSLDNVIAFWVQGVRDYYVAVAEVCEGKGASLTRVEDGVKFVLGLAQFDLKDDARRGRDDAGYIPMADWDGAGRGGGGMPGGGGGMPGGGGPGGGGGR